MNDLSAPSFPAFVVGRAAVVCFSDEDAPPSVPGFVESRFSPLVRQAVDLCWADAKPAGPDRFADRTGMLMLTAFGDSTTTDLASRRLVEGRVRNPLLFYQSVPTSILGFITRELGITGPLTCLSVHDGGTRESFETAGLMLADDAVDQLLLIGVELAGTARTTAAGAGVPGAVRDPGLGDAAVALLLRRQPDPAGPAAAAVDLGALAGAPAPPFPAAAGKGSGPLRSFGGLWAVTDHVRENQ
ncbi:ketosynthase [Streptomyces parvus]|uniref:ketosynthase n=1 Tax=Streptomyces parvus TaxID=66428 RepID=UPI0037BA36DC